MNKKIQILIKKIFDYSSMNNYINNNFDSDFIKNFKDDIFKNKKNGRENLLGEFWNEKIIGGNSKFSKIFKNIEMKFVYEYISKKKDLTKENIFLKNYFGKYNE